MMDRYAFTLGNAINYGANHLHGRMGLMEIIGLIEEGMRLGMPIKLRF